MKGSARADAICFRRHACCTHGRSMHHGVYRMGVALKCSRWTWRARPPLICELITTALRSCLVHQCFAASDQAAAARTFASCFIGSILRRGCAMCRKFTQITRP